jgi:hypothetical protein
MFVGIYLLNPFWWSLFKLDEWAKFLESGRQLQIKYGKYTEQTAFLAVRHLYSVVYTIQSAIFQDFSPQKMIDFQWDWCLLARFWKLEGRFFNFGHVLASLIFVMELAFQVRLRSCQQLGTSDTGALDGGGLPLQVTRVKVFGKNLSYA